MKFSLEQRLEIGREIYSKSITLYEASIKYGINNYTARDYMRLYRDKNQLPAFSENKTPEEIVEPKKKKPRFVNYEDLSLMNKDELIDEVIKARVEAERAKKGYLVKGDGREKVFINIKNTSSK